MADTIEIALTDERPVEIDPDKWPIVATAGDFWGGKVRHEAFETCDIKVRANATGRCIVYGIFRTKYEGKSWREAGRLVESLDEAPEAIRMVVDALDLEEACEALIQECIADLPSRMLAD